MTKLAVFTDLHANLPALRAALADIAREGCDALVHTGDAIAIGPQPAECLDLLLGMPHSTCLIAPQSRQGPPMRPVTSAS